MKKFYAVAAMAVMLCLAGLVMSGEAQAQRTGVEPAFNKCLEDCVELDEAACKHCCEKAFEHVIWNCRLQLSHCVSRCTIYLLYADERRCERSCESEMRSCLKEAKGAHICP